MKKSRTVKEAAFDILNELGHPLHYKELTKLVLEECNLEGKTPHETVRSLIGTDKRFKRVSEGVYALSDWKEYPEVRFAKDMAYNFLFNRGEPVGMVELGDAILSERQFVGGAKQVMRNVLRSDKRFYFDSDNGLVGLVEWREVES